MQNRAVAQKTIYTMRHIIRYFATGTLMLLAGLSCTKEKEPAQTHALLSQATFSLTSVGGLTSPIRVFGFDADNHFIAENSSIALSDTSVNQRMVLPIGNDKIVLLTGAGTKGDNASIATVMSPHMASYSDAMLRLTDAGAGLPEPTDYFYGKRLFDLQPGPIVNMTIEIKHLCSKSRVEFINSVENTIDSAQVYIENAGREIRFDGTVSSVGTTVRHGFIKSTNNLLPTDEFLLFPSKSGVKPIVHAIFYLASGHQKVFRKELNYQFISNRILKFTFDLTDLEDNIQLTTTIADWDGTTSQTVQSDLKLRFTNGNALNYTKADVTLQHNFSPGNSYPIHLYGLALAQNTSNQLELSVPLTNLEQGAYTITSVSLYDTDGSFEALRSPVDFDMGFALNSIDADVLSRTQHEYNMIREWLKVMDGNNGATFPSTTTLNQMQTMTDAQMATLLPTLGFTSATIDGQSRITEFNIPSSATALSSFIVSDNARLLMKLNRISLPTCLVRTITAKSLPALATIILSNNTMTSIDLSDCPLLNSFSTNFTTADKLALLSLNVTSTSVSVIPTGLTNLQTLRWGDCSLTDVSVVLSCPNLSLLDISYNNLTLYPDVHTLTQLTSYNVSNNSIISCALSYMRIFGADNILPQNTGYNWWCP